MRPPSASRRLPPSGYTRAAPSPPRAPRRAFARPAAPVLAGLVLAGLVTFLSVAGAGDGTGPPAPPAGVASRPASGRPGPAPSGAGPHATGTVPSGPEPSGAAPSAAPSAPRGAPHRPAASPGERAPDGRDAPARSARASGSPAPRPRGAEPGPVPAEPRPVPRPRNVPKPEPEPEPVPVPAPEKKPAEPAPRDPSWARAECARRFPGDPVRARACAAALGARRGG
ncbi:hypothetical protein [Actinomadura algeriensis]|uniref:Uncharacterized protein n=1 Tax=Actinomadura algeriensis TaxID=1679523 RepID=A0ABR9JXX7_9ACTN|nr:hypothetical protein [Actinomadura algeriensis]MBE1535418.1 hypothetical protein [Actinomadura algeriensis]